MMDVYSRFLESLRASDLSEKEEKDVQENMQGRKDRPHSRDKAGLGPPKHDNRRKRTQDEDSDIKPPVEADPDLSLNYKYSANPEEKPPKFAPPKIKGVPTDISSGLSKLESKMNAVSPKFARDFQQKKKEIIEEARTNPREASLALTEASNAFNNSATKFYNVFMASQDVAATIPEAWKKVRGESTFYSRAGIVESLKQAAMKSSLPKSVKAPVLSGAGGKIVDPEAIKAILEPDERVVALPDREVKRFVALATAYKILRDNPDKISADQLKDDAASEAITKQVKAVNDLGRVTSAWHKIMQGFKTDEAGRVDVSKGDWGAVLGQINNFLYKSTVTVDPGQYMVEIARQMKEEHGEVPREVQSILEGYGAPLPDLKSVVEERVTRDKRERDKAKAAEKEEKARAKRQKRDESRAEQDAMEKARESNPPGPTPRIRAIRGIEPETDEPKPEPSKQTPRVKAIRGIEPDTYEPEKPERNETEPVKKEERERDEWDKWAEWEAEGAEAAKKEMQRQRDEAEARDEKADKREWYEIAEERIKADSERDGQEEDEEKARVKELEEKVRKLAFDVSASYGSGSRRMINRSAAYHGIVQQGHPTDPPGSTPQSYDKRYFGKEHFDSIIASAKKFLTEDWLKHGWGNDPGDVPTRAALDLAISTADGSLYQSKIDAPTYNMLLSKLAGWDFDTFNETVFSGQKTRKTASMINSSAAHAILKIADDLRSTHPNMSIQIIKNLHDMMRSAVAADPEKPEGFDQPKKSPADESQERKLIDDLVKQEAKTIGANPADQRLKDLGDEIQKILDEWRQKGGQSAEGSKPVASGTLPLKVIVQMARVSAEYRQFMPLVIAAAKKMKDDKKKGKKPAEKGKKKPEEKEKKETVAKEPPKPSVPEKKGKKPAKKRKSSIAFDASDLSW